MLLDKSFLDLIVSSRAPALMPVRQQLEYEKETLDIPIKTIEEEISESAPSNKIELKRNRKLSFRSVFKINEILEEAFENSEFESDKILINVENTSIVVSIADLDLEKVNELSARLDFENENKAWNLTLSHNSEIRTDFGAFERNFIKPYVDTALRREFSRILDIFIEAMPTNLQFSFNTKNYAKLSKEEQSAVIWFWKNKNFVMNSDGILISPEMELEASDDKNQA